MWAAQERRRAPCRQGSMAHSPPPRRRRRRRPGVVVVVVFQALAILAFLALAEAAKSSGKGRVKRKSAQLGTLDKDYHHKREECGRTEEVATSPECVGSDVRRENCLLKCVSPECYEKIYEADPLEEGELDTTRGRLFKSCVRTEKRKELRAASKDEI